MSGKKICPKCSYDVKNCATLTRHQLFAQTPQKFPCPFCCMSYQTEIGLESHLKKEHSEIEPLNTDGKTRANTIIDNDTTPMNELFRGKRRLSTTSHVSSSVDGDPNLRENNTRLILQNDTTIQPPPTNTTDMMRSPVKKNISSKNGGEPSQKKARLEISQEFGLEIPDVTFKGEEHETLPVHLAETPELDEHPHLLINQQNDTNVLNSNNSIIDSGNLLKDEFGNIQIQNPNSSVCNGYNQEFLLKVWGILLNDNSVGLTTPNINISKTVIVSFLAGKGLEKMTMEEMDSFFQTKPHLLVGNFIIGLMLVEYMLSMTAADAALFAEKKDKLPEQLYNLVEKVAVFMNLRHLRQTTTFETLMQSIPESLRHVINLSCFEILTMETSNVDNRQSSSFLTMNEFSCASSLREILLQLMFTDLATNKEALLIDGNAYRTKVEKWTKLANFCVDDMVQSKKTYHFEILLRHDLQMKIGTTTMFNIIDETRNIIPVNLHADVVHRFGGELTTYTNIPIPGSHQDMRTLVMLLYDDRLYDPSIIKNRLSLGVYKLALHLQIENIWWLLFQNHPYKDLMTRRNRLDILHIAICTRNDKCVDDIASSFEMWMHHDEQFTKCLNGLSPEQVKYFIKRASSFVETLELYKILIQWSFSSTPWDCTDELNASYKADVYRNFVLVKNSLNLAKLRNHKHIICSQNYVFLREIENEYIQSQLNVEILN